MAQRLSCWISSSTLEYDSHCHESWWQQERQAVKSAAMHLQSHPSYVATSEPL